MYNRYKEDCCICDSENTQVKIEVSQSFVDEISFSYQLVYIHCNECGYEFGNRDLTLLNVSNKNEAQRRAMQPGNVLSSFKVDILSEIMFDVKLPDGMYRQMKVNSDQTLMKSLKTVTQTILYQNEKSEPGLDETRFFGYA